MAASATLALKPGVWFRRGRLLIVSPDSLGTACPLSGRNSTYRPVQILEAGSVNGTLFESNSSWWLRMAGDLARGVETVVADHVVSHLWEHTYLLWFDEQLTPHLRQSKPPAAADLVCAKWGVGGQGVGLRDGNVSAGADRAPDSRTAVAIDGQRNLLFLAVGQNISPRLMPQELAGLGAKERDAS
jgi:hypothetical protein